MSYALPMPPGWRPRATIPDPAIHAVDPRFEKYWALNCRPWNVLATACAGRGPVWVRDGRYLFVSDIPNARSSMEEETAPSSLFFANPSNFVSQWHHPRTARGRLVHLTLRACGPPRDPPNNDGAITC